MPELKPTKIQKNFRKTMKKLDKQGKIPLSHRGGRYTVSFQDQKDDTENRTGLTQEFNKDCLHGCAFTIGSIIAKIVIFIIVLFILAWIASLIQINV